MSAPKIIPSPDPPFFDGIAGSLCNLGMGIVMLGWVVTIFGWPFVGLKPVFAVFAVTSWVGWPMFAAGFILTAILPKRKPRKP